MTTRAPALPTVIGHRGAAAYAPENTLASFRRAKALGCRWVEFDVRLSGDGMPMVCHDSRLDRTTDGSGVIAAMPLAAIRNCDAGAWFDPGFAGEKVPILDEVLILAAELGLSTNIEIKSDRGREYATAAAVARTLTRHRPVGILVSSFQRAAVTAIRDLAPHIPRGVLFRLVPRNWAAIAQRLGCIAIGADYRYLRARRIAAIRAAGYDLLSYTVNSPARARLLLGWGVTSVFSDAPDIIIKTSAGHGAVMARQGTLR
ncbi:MAG TPA: glycerophosphoryl diester phosphodiesterase [Stellaceae bacterium]|nr:glycerophosphoryl diester phosphodiesterase [Stellaceae bacterium]